MKLEEQLSIYRPSNNEELLKLQVHADLIVFVEENLLGADKHSTMRIFWEWGACFEQVFLTLRERYLQKHSYYDEGGRSLLKGIIDGELHSDVAKEYPKHFAWMEQVDVQAKSHGERFYALLQEKNGELPLTKERISGMAEEYLQRTSDKSKHMEKHHVIYFAYRKVMNNYFADMANVLKRTLGDIDIISEELQKQFPYYGVGNIHFDGLEVEKALGCVMTNQVWTKVREEVSGEPTVHDIGVLKERVRDDMSSLLKGPFTPRTEMMARYAEIGVDEINKHLVAYIHEKIEEIASRQENVRQYFMNWKQVLDNDERLCNTLQSKSGRNAEKLITNAINKYLRKNNVVDPELVCASWMKDEEFRHYIEL